MGWAGEKKGLELHCTIMRIHKVLYIFVSTSSCSLPPKDGTPPSPAVNLRFPDPTTYACVHRSLVPATGDIRSPTQPTAGSGRMSEIGMKCWLMQIWFGGSPAHGTAAKEARRRCPAAAAAARADRRRGGGGECGQRERRRLPTAAEVRLQD